jgi:rhodanese-related sulfurtransferase
MHQIPAFLRSVVFVAALVCALPLGAAEAKVVTPKEAAALVASGKAVLVDVRETEECAASGVAQPAKVLPKSDFDGDQKQWQAFLAANKGKQVLVYCASGRRSKAVAEALAAKGIESANVGGLKDWAAAGLPVRKIE